MDPSAAHPRRPGRAAGADDLPALVQALLDAAPGRGVLTERAPNDPRALVRFEHQGHRWLVHPGELDHPLVFLRSLQGVARAVDERLLHKAGFTLSEVIQLALRHTDHTLSRLGSVWPADPEDQEEGRSSARLPMPRSRRPTPSASTTAPRPARTQGAQRRRWHT